MQVVQVDRPFRRPVDKNALGAYPYGKALRGVFPEGKAHAEAGCEIRRLHASLYIAQGGPGMVEVDNGDPAMIASRERSAQAEGAAVERCLGAECNGRGDRDIRLGKGR